MTKALKKCPFNAAHTDIDLYETESGIDGLSGEYYVMCNICYCKTGNYKTRKEALKAWEWLLPERAKDVAKCIVKCAKEYAYEFISRLAMQFR